jgi:Dynamin family/Dynamin central region
LSSDSSLIGAASDLFTNPQKSYTANMGDQAQIEETRLLLQSKDHEEILDTIDRLRLQGISRHLDLPQLIVCGDQSSGKSSVLEAVSKIRFPTKDNLCTRFATELILRRGLASASVSIVPNAHRSEPEKAELLKFHHENVDLKEFESLVNDAKKAMGLDRGTKAFSNDILRVEISGPNQNPLTLVDLPGLFAAANKDQSDADVKMVQSLVLSYMRNPRSIILAVVSAKSDLNLQIVTKHASEIDPQGFRTLGIITKPDTLHIGSDSEKSYVGLAKNEDVHFRLGWHVLRNRDYDMRNCSAEVRDEKEREFFSQGIWASLPPSDVGISSLMPRLSSLLKEQILEQLPSLIEDATNGVKQCKDILARLGESRATVTEQHVHLLRVSQEFSSLVRSAIDGGYMDEFFGNALEDLGKSKRLRAVIQKICLSFSHTIRSRGHAKHIVDDSDDLITKPGNPPKIRRSHYIDEVMILMESSRGRELPGTYNPLIIGDLFYQQSARWTDLVDRFTRNILGATRTTLNTILDHIADKATGEGLIRYIINPGMDALQRDLEAMMESILEPHRKGHLITYNHYFTENIQRAKARHRNKSLTQQLESFFGSYLEENGQVHQATFDLKGLVSALDQSTEADMDRYACSEAIDCMQAYYKVSICFLFLLTLG